MSKAFVRISQIGNKEQIEVVLATANFYTHGVCLKSDGITLTANTRVTKRTAENPNLSTEGFEVVTFEEGERLFKTEIYSQLFAAMEESPLVPGHIESEVAFCNTCHTIQSKANVVALEQGRHKCKDCQTSAPSWCHSCNESYHLHKLHTYANGIRHCASCQKESSTAKANNN